MLRRILIWCFALWRKIVQKLRSLKDKARSWWETLFSLAREAARPVGTKWDAPAPLAARDAPAAVPDHPVLTELRRRAALELFDWLGFTHVPGQFWPILDALRDPADAIEAFIR